MHGQKNIKLTVFSCEEYAKKIVTLFSKYFPINWTRNDGDVLFCMLWSFALLITTEVAGRLLYSINHPLEAQLEIRFVSVRRGFVDVLNLRNFWSEWKPFRISMYPTVHRVPLWWWEQGEFAGKGKQHAWSRWNTCGILDLRELRRSRRRGEIHVTVSVNEIKYLIGLDLSGLG